MAVTSGFFDSIEGDRKYTAEQMTTYFKGLVSDGVYQTVGDAMTVRATGEGLNITVGTGRALCRTHWINIDEPLALSLSPASTENARIDLVVIRHDTTARTVSIEVVEGTPSATPSVPATQHTDLVWELVLARIFVEKNTSLLTQEKITDLRPSSECGWVTGLVTQVNTSQLFLQFQSAYQQQFQIYADYLTQIQNEYEQQFQVFENYLTQKQNEFDTFFKHLTEQLNVDTTVRKYQNSFQIAVQTGQTVKTLNIGISEYNSDDDILFVYLDGTYLVEKIDYTISGTGSNAQITFENPLTKTHVICFIVLKSVIGGS